MYVCVWICMCLHALLVMLLYHIKSPFPFPCCQIPSQTVRNLALILFNIYTHLFSVRTLLNVLSSFPLLSSSLLRFLRHSAHHCPSLCNIPSLHCGFSYPCCYCHSLNSAPSPHPAPKMLLSLSLQDGKEQEGGKWREGKITMPFHWWMGLRLSQMFSTTHMHLCLMNKSFFSIHLLSFTLSALPTSLQGCVSV